MTTATPRAGRGGRPRDPQLDGKILTVARDLLAEGGLAGYTADAIAARARVGKASIFRRWDSMDDLLVDVVRELGVRDLDYGPEPGGRHEDLTRLLLATTTGPAAEAEAAVLSSIGRSADLRAAYAAGPGLRLALAVEEAERRARRRGEPPWLSSAPVFAGIRLLQHELFSEGWQPDPVYVGDLVETVVVPGLLP